MNREDRKVARKKRVAQQAEANALAAVAETARLKDEVDRVRRNLELLRMEKNRVEADRQDQVRALEEAEQSNTNLRGRITRLLIQNKDLEDRLAVLQGRPTGGGALDRASVMKIIRFCHPDRNAARVEEANEVTKLLTPLL